MNLSGQLLFFFSALGAFNGLLLSGYLFIASPKALSQRLLAALMLTVSLRISKSVWYFFDPSIGKPFLQVGLSACLLIGPLLFLYVACVTRRMRSLTARWVCHPLAFLILITGIGIGYPYADFPAIWYSLYPFINAVWGGYLLISAWMLFNYCKPLFGQWSDWSGELLLCANVLAGVAIVWFAYFTASYTSYIVGALSFTFILYISLVVVAIAHKRPQSAPKPYANRKIDEDTASAMLQRLSTLMEQDRLYKDASITLPVIARKVQVTTPQLSQLLNDNLGKSFAQYINELRINEAKRLLQSSPGMTMELVAESAGYNSTSTFYNAFRQVENTTPAKYRKLIGAR